MISWTCYQCDSFPLFFPQSFKKDSDKRAIIKRTGMATNIKNQILGSIKKTDGWDGKKLFLDKLFIGYITFDFYQNVSKTLFEIIDENKEDHVIGTALAMVTEVARRILENEVKLHQIGTNKTSRILVEEITSNILSRANINNNTVRLGIIHYLSVIKPVSKMELQRILTRFGESLLMHVFQIYFSGKKESKLAFYFLSKHLLDFMCSAPALAEMSASVMQNQMFKNPKEFPDFIKKYIKCTIPYAGKSHQFTRAIAIHLAFLTKSVCEVEQKDLSKDLLQVINMFLSLIQKVRSPHELMELRKIFFDIISSSKTLTAKDILVDFDKNKKKSQINQNKGTDMKLDSLAVTPMEEVLFLAAG